MIFDTPFGINFPKSYRTSKANLLNDFSVIEIGFNRVPPDLKHISKRNVYILHYITDGKGVYLNENFDSSCCYVVTPNELEIVISDHKEPFEAYWIMFQGPASMDILKKCGLPVHNSVFKFSKTKQCAEILKNALFNVDFKNELEEACIMNSALYQILALHAQEIKEFKEDAIGIAQKVKELLHTSYYHPIKIGDIAHQLNYARNYLYTAFKKEYGVSPQEYLLTLRIKKAKQLLADKTKSISINEVAFAVGFTDPLYFSRIFHKKTGISPTAFKANT